MVKLIGAQRVNTAVFISGIGSNLKSLILNSLKKNSKFKISLIISDNPKAKGLNFANKYKIKKKIINYKFFDNAEKSILKELRKNNIDLVCLAGYMKILSSSFIKSFKGKIINIHPSLLPKYKGLNTHQRAIENNDKFCGCTVHFVNSKLDSGKVILQKKVKIFKNDTPKKLSKKILKQEHILYPKAIMKLFANL